MSLREDLELSLAMEPSDAQTAMRRLRILDAIQTALERALAKLKRRDMRAFHHFLDHAARLYLGIMENPMASQATVAESDTPSLIAELKRRAKEESDVEAARFVRGPLPRRVRSKGGDRGARA